MMSETRHKALLDGVTVLARKVYAVVPIAESWSRAQIQAELTRQGLPIRDRHTLEGCLGALERAGLISKSDDQYRREPVRASKHTVKLVAIPLQPEEAEVPATPTPATVPASKTESKADGVVDTLGKLATKARGLSEMLKQWADEVDEAALEIEDEVSRNGDAAVKLKQLQALLKGLS